MRALHAYFAVQTEVQEPIKELEEQKSTKKNKKYQSLVPVGPALTSQEKRTLSESPVFMYPELLPTGGFITQNKTSRLVWNHAEDV